VEEALVSYFLGVLTSSNPLGVAEVVAVLPKKNYSKHESRVSEGSHNRGG
jgi:hypothetical protein